jgi:hypothetical protein
LDDPLEAAVYHDIRIVDEAPLPVRDGLRQVERMVAHGQIHSPIVISPAFQADWSDPSVEGGNHRQGETQ